MFIGMKVLHTHAHTHAHTHTHTKIYTGKRTNAKILEHVSDKIMNPRLLRIFHGGWQSASKINLQRERKKKIKLRKGVGFELFSYHCKP